MTSKCCLTEQTENSNGKGTQSTHVDGLRDGTNIIIIIEALSIYLGPICNRANVFKLYMGIGDDTFFEVLMIFVIGV